MKYILQINTGNTESQNYTAEQIIERIEHISQYISVSKVIFGWYDDPEENKKICNFLRNHDTTPYYWMPVFAEIIDLNNEDEYVESRLFDSQSSQLSEGDNFDFVCQSSERNIEYIKRHFEKINAEGIFDGVFLDRIRYKSPALSKDGIFGCQCSRCQSIYGAVDKDIYEKLIPSEIKDGIYLYEDQKINELMKKRRDIINSQIKKLCQYFKDNDVKVGLDTFALCIADFVGQDIVTLGKYAEFIKPMFYLKTTAPAGLPYELDGLPAETVKAVERLWNTELTTMQATVKQCNYLTDRKINITSGIDVNHIEGICNADNEYVVEYIRKLKENSCDEIVLCWNAMMLSDELLAEIAKI